MNWAFQFPGYRLLDQQRQLCFRGSEINNLCESLAKIRFCHFHPDRVNLGPDQIAVANVDARRGHNAGNHSVRLVEVILVMRASSSAVGVNERRLSTSSGTAAALGVVGWCGGNVAQID